MVELGPSDRPRAPGRDRQRRLRGQRAADPGAARASCSGADLPIPDGMPVVWASRLTRHPLRERTTGVDLVPAIVERAARGRVPPRAVRRRTRRGRASRRGPAPARSAAAATVVAVDGPAVGADGAMDAGVAAPDCARVHDPTSSASRSGTRSRSAGSPATAPSIGAPVLHRRRRQPRLPDRDHPAGAGVDAARRARVAAPGDVASRAASSGATPATSACSCPAVVARRGGGVDAVTRLVPDDRRRRSTSARVLSAPLPDGVPEPAIITSSPRAGRDRRPAPATLSTTPAVGAGRAGSDGSTFGGWAADRRCGSSRDGDPMAGTARTTPRRLNSDGRSARGR